MTIRIYFKNQNQQQKITKKTNKTADDKNWDKDFPERCSVKGKK